MRLDSTVAAGQIAHLLAGEGVNVAEARARACDLVAGSGGLAGVDSGLVSDINRLDENVSVVCLGPFETVRANDLVARVNIVSPDVDAGVLVEVTRRCSQSPVFCLHRFQPCRVGVMVTRLADSDAA